MNIPRWRRGRARILRPTPRAAGHGRAKTAGPRQPPLRDGGHALEVELTLGGDPAALDRGWRAAVPAGGARARAAAAQHLLRYRRLPPAPARLHAAYPRGRGAAGADAQVGGAVGRRSRAQAQRMVAPRGGDGAKPARRASDPAVRAALGPLRPTELDSGLLHRRHAAHRRGRGRRRRVAAPRWSRWRSTVARSGRATGIDTISELELELVEGPGERALRARHDAARLRAAAHPDREQGQARLRAGGRRGLCRLQGAGARAATGDLRGGRARRDLPRLREPLRREPRRGAGPQRPRGRAPIPRRPAPAALGHLGVQDRAAAGRYRLDRARGEPPHRPARPGPRLGRVHHRDAASRPRRPGRATTLSTGLPPRPRGNAPGPTSRRRRCAAPEYTSFLLGFSRWIETAGWRTGADEAALDKPLAGLAGCLLDKRHARVLKRGRGFERLSDDRLHRLRITLKKLRYAGEFFAAQFPESKPRPYIRAARRLQDEFGRLNDAVVAERRLRELLHAHRDSDDRIALGIGAGQVMGWHARARGEVRAAGSRRTGTPLPRPPPIGAPPAAGRMGDSAAIGAGHVS